MSDGDDAPGVSAATTSSYKKGKTPTQLLAAAEAIDGYRGAIANSWINTSARQGMTYSPFYLEQSEAERLLREVDEIPLLNGATIVVMHPTAENGFPHTRPLDLVCMPTTSVKGVATTDLARTLRHEAIHIHQRRRPAEWVAACQKEGWAMVGSGQIPQRLRERCRLNPDTLRPKQFWAWDQHYVPLPLFVREDQPRLNDVQVKWLDLRVNGLLSEPPPTFRYRYGHAPSQPEHPFELLAVEAADDGITTDAALIANLLRK